MRSSHLGAYFVDRLEAESMLCGTPKLDIASWRDKRIFVLGDVMLDRFVSGRVERLSPEAPIPILHFQSEKLMLGGAANVARDIAALAGQAVLVGVWARTSTVI